LLGCGPRAPQYKELSDLLDGRAVERFRDARQHRLPLITIVVEDPDLDQLMRRECNVDFVNHGRREPMMTDRNDRVKAVRARTQLATKCGRQRFHFPDSKLRCSSMM
jgi:hypothetical protein